MAVPRFCYQSIAPSAALFCCSYLQLTLDLFSYLQLKLSFFVSHMLYCHCSSCTIGRKSLNHFSINILLGKCRDTVHCGKVTAQAKGGYGFTACRLQCWFSAGDTVSTARAKELSSVFSAYLIALATEDVGLGPLFWGLISMCNYPVCGIMSCSGHVSIAISSPPA